MGLDLGALTILAILGYGISAGATIWSLKPPGAGSKTEKARDRRFSRQVSIALAMASFLVATVSLGFEKLNEQARARLADQKEARREQREIQQRIRQDAIAARAEEQSRAIATQVGIQGATRRLEATRQQLLTLGIAAEERERDLATAEREQRNARRVMIALWQEANRVTGESIVATISTRCLTHGRSAFPRVVPEGSRARLVIGTPAAPGRPAALTSLISSNQRFSQETSSN